MSSYIKTTTRWCVVAFVMISLVFTMTLTSNAATKAPTKISLKTTASVVDIGGKVTVSVKSVAPKGASKTVKYYSSNKSVATVSSKGVVTGKKSGSVYIKAVSKSKSKKSAKIKITVKNLKARSVTLDKSSMELAKDATGLLTATVKGSVGFYNQGVKFTSSDQTVATVDSKGKVTAQKKAGTAIITATEVGGSATAECKVTVSIAEAYSNPKQVFVSPEWVKSVIDGDQPGYENYVIADVAWLTNYCSNQHIPGAFHINSDEVEYVDWTPWEADDADRALVGNGIDDLWDYNKDGNNYGKITFGDAGDVPTEQIYNYRSDDELKIFFKKHGISKDTKLILYGTKSNAGDLGRVAFAMVNCGVKDVKIMDGGINAWINAGLPTTTESFEPKAGGDSFDFGNIEHKYVLSIEDCKDKLESDKNFKLVSIRSEDEFTGAKIGYAYIDHAGEPQGAVWGKNIGDYGNSDGTIVSADTLKKYLAESNVDYDDQNVELSFYCGTGWRATIPFFIAYQDGRENITMYDGGWYQWELRWQDNPKEYPRQLISTRQASYYSTAAFTKKNVRLNVGDTEDNSAVFTPASANPDVIYSSGDDKVATIDSDGKITAVGEGSTTIYAKIVDKEGKQVGRRITSGVIVSE